MTREKQIASLFEGQWHKNYVASKLRTDPVYRALADHLKGTTHALMDLGCGLGLSAFYLRGEGHDFAITGLDYDSSKIEGAKKAAALCGARDMEFRIHDARTGLPEHLGNVSILDILQFFTLQEQETLLKQAAERVAPGGKLIIRSGVRDDSWRFKITVLGDLLAKATFWMKAAPTHYPTSSDFTRILSAFGKVEVSPLWGGTPFNNYLIVLSRPA